MAFVLSLTPLPTRASLFPYTTLFRSRRAHRAEQGEHPGVPSLSTLARADRAQPARAGAHLVQDRKSTRLNSSHLGISYAVFCLKKKHLIAKFRAQVFVRAAVAGRNQR